MSDKFLKIFCGVLLSLLCLTGCGDDNVNPVKDEPVNESIPDMDKQDMDKQDADISDNGMPDSGLDSEDTQTLSGGEDMEATIPDNNEKEEEEEMYLELAESYKGLNDANPLMTQRFGADPYAMVYGDRVYFYMTADAFEYDDEKNVTENTYSKIKSINVISTDDMINFTDHGSILVAGNEGAAKWAHNSWAPAAAWKEIDGKPKFFLYFADAGGGIGVVTADSPTGPFKDPLGHGLITRNTPNCEDITWLFDPAVMVDEDGRGYLYFGGGVPEGKIADPGNARVAALGDDMISIVGEPVKVEAPYLFEDSGIHKFNNKYYYTYCSNWQVDAAGTEKYGFHNAEIVCMESDSPMGPFTYKETILDNPGRVFGLYGNNHHCVFTFKDRWYMTYHTRMLEQKMGIEHGYRATNVDEFTMNEDGSIGKIKMTYRGREQLKFVNPYEVNRAVNMAVMGGLACVPCDSVSKYYGCGNMALSAIDTGDFIKVQGVDFEDGGVKEVRLSAFNTTGQTGRVQFRLDTPEGTLLAAVDVESMDNEEWTEYTAAVTGSVRGVHDIYLIFEGTGYELETWQFIR